MIRNRKTRQNGFVIIIVLCMVMMLAVMLFGFHSESRIALRIIDSSIKSEQALNCARSGLNITIATLTNTIDASTSRPSQSLVSGKKTFDLSDGICTVTIVEENSKLNINMLKDKEGKLNRGRIDQLLKLIDIINRDAPDKLPISYDLIPSIIDWVDQDDRITHLPFIKKKNMGAESKHYNSLKAPYTCRNKPFDIMQETLLVKGMTPQIYNRMRNYLTVYGDGLININYASRPVIESLSKKMDSSLAQLIIEQRKYQPFKNVAQISDVPGMTDEIFYAISNKITVDEQGQYYQLTSRGIVDNIDCIITALIRKNTKTKNIEIVLYEES